MSEPAPRAAGAVRESARARHRAWHRRFGTRLRHSLRLKLIALFVLFAFAISLAFIGGMQRAFSGGWREAARPVLADYVDRLAAEIGSPPDVARARALTERLPLSVRISGPLVNWSSDASSSSLARGDFGRGQHAAEHGFAPLLARETADGHRIAFGLSEPSSWRGRPQRIGWITLAVLLLLTLLAYWLIRRMLAPIHEIGAGAERFGAGDFRRPIPVRRRDELGDLAARINASAQELQRMLDAKRALLLALSHELRSPLTRARLNVELLPATPDTGKLRAALLRDLAEMRDLIEMLLEGERLAGRHVALQRAPADLAQIARELVDETMRGARKKRNVVLKVAPGLPLLALDAARIRVLLRNLIDNALRHGSSSGDALEEQPPEIDLSADEEWLSLSVRDFGPGVAPDLLPHLGEPFFRADAARQRATGGIGLGLYLCRLIAEAHGGSMSARNAAPGLEIVVRLPIGPLRT